jgi:hypothetical protein
VTHITNNLQLDAEDNPLESVWVVWKRPTERYGNGTLKCDTSDVDALAFKKNGGDRRMGSKNPFMCTHRRPYGHTSKGKKIRHETKKGLDRGLVSELCSVLYSST